MVHQEKERGMGRMRLWANGSSWRGIRNSRFSGLPLFAAVGLRFLLLGGEIMMRVHFRHAVHNVVVTKAEETKFVDIEFI